MHVARAHNASARHWRRLPRSRQASPVCCLPTHSVTRYSRAQLPICQSTRIPGNPNRIRGISMTLITLRTRPTTGPAPPAACCLPACPRAKNGTRSRRVSTHRRAARRLLPKYTRFLERVLAYACHSAAQNKHLRRMALRGARCTRCTYMGASAVWALRGLNVRSSAISRRVKH